MTTILKLWIAALAAALLGAVVPSQAATIYFAGTEDTSFTYVGAGTLTYAGGAQFYRTAWTRSATAVTTPSSADPPAHRAYTPTFTAVSTLWVHAMIYPNSANTTTLNNQALILRSPDGVSRIVLRQTATAGTLKASKVDAARTFTDLATATEVLLSGTGYGGGPNQIDLKVVYGCTAGDEIKLYVNHVLAINYTGASICTDAATQLNQLDLGQVSSAQYNTWSEVIVSDSDTRSMSLWTLAPVAAGNTQGWTPSTVGNINETTLSDVSLVSDGTGNVLSQWTTPVTPPAGTFNVHAIVQEARMRIGASGPTGFDWSLRTASTNYLAGVVNAPTTGFANFGNYIWATNPNTAAPWVIGAIASGFNLGVKSLP